MQKFRPERLRRLDFLDLIRRLTEVLVTENALLEDPKTHDLRPIVAEKTELFHMFDSRLRSFGGIAWHDRCAAGRTA